MNKLHQELLAAIKSHSRDSIDQNRSQRYVGTPRFCYGAPVPDKRRIVAKFLKEHQDLSAQQLIEVADCLYNGESFDERSMAGHLLERSSIIRSEIELSQIETWLDNLVGWAEVDTTCQSCFTPEEMLNRWDEWEKSLSRLKKSRNINQRRASLVLLVSVVRKSNDRRLLDFSLQQIADLESERDILITKAISWLLRSLIVHHPKAVEEYITQHQGSLPKIAVRETRTKLTTGKKNHGKKK